MAMQFNINLVLLSQQVVHYLLQTKCQRGSCRVAFGRATVQYQQSQHGWFFLNLHLSAVLKSDTDISVNSWYRHTNKSGQKYRSGSRAKQSLCKCPWFIKLYYKYIKSNIRFFFLYWTNANLCVKLCWISAKFCHLGGWLTQEWCGVR